MITIAYKAAVKALNILVIIKIILNLKLNGR